MDGILHHRKLRHDENVQSRLSLSWRNCIHACANFSAYRIVHIIGTELSSSVPVQMSISMCQIFTSSRQRVRSRSLVRELPDSPVGGILKTSLSEVLDRVTHGEGLHPERQFLSAVSLQKRNSSLLEIMISGSLGVS